MVNELVRCCVWMSSLRFSIVVGSCVMIERVKRWMGMFGNVCLDWFIYES